MNEVELLKKIAHLESVNDLMATELEYIDALMKDIGFAYGLRTVKTTACEIIDEKSKTKKKRRQ